MPFPDAGTRVGQAVRNQLIFIAGRGAGETKTPKYTVDLSVSSGTTGVLYLPSSDTSAAGRTTVTRIVHAEERQRRQGSEIRQSRSHIAGGLPDPGICQAHGLFAILEDRAAREVAELVGADIAAALSR